MRPLLVVCATHRDRRELARLGQECIFHDYASVDLERLAMALDAAAIADPEAELTRLCALGGEQRVAGILSTDDYPGTALAAIVAARLGLCGPPPRAVLLAQHKHCARHIGRRAVAEATPEFELSDGRLPALLAGGPVFVKPCKSFLSIGASAVHEPSEWPAAARAARLPVSFFDVFEQLCRQHGDIDAPADGLLVERLLRGAQATVEGVRQGGRTFVLGVVDSVFHPEVPSFSRFELPSSLPARAQQALCDAAARLVEAIGYDDGGFNVEMIWDADAGRAFVVEVNPRISSQFADLFEKVAGVNSYALIADIARGRPIGLDRRMGTHAFAASCVVRRLHDARTAAVPSDEDVAAATAQDPGARIEILTAPGALLSDALQDGVSYRYAIVNLGADHRADLLARLERVRAALPFRFDEAPRADQC